MGTVSFEEYIVECMDTFCMSYDEAFDCAVEYFEGEDGV